MAEIVMYTTNYCPFCTRAKDLLKRKGHDANIQEFDVTSDDALREEMMEKTGGKRTVPQIFINGTHVGGFDDLSALDRDGKLDDLLSQSA